MTKKLQRISVQGIEIVTFKKNEKDYISLTDISRYKDQYRSDYILQNWMRTRSAIEFLGLWEKLNNPNFNSIEFDGFRNGAGSNSFVLSPSKWMLKTRADSAGTISTGPSATTQSYCYCPNAVPAGQQRCGKIEKRVTERVLVGQKR